MGEVCIKVRGTVVCSTIPSLWDAISEVVAFRMLVDRPASELLQSGPSHVLSHDWSGFGRVVTGNEIIAVSSMERDKIMAKEVSVAAANKKTKNRYTRTYTVCDWLLKTVCS